MDPSQSLTPGTILQRLPEVSVHMDGANLLTVEAHGRSVLVGPHGLYVLDAFAHPRTLAEGLERLKVFTRGAVDWMDLMNTVVTLFAGGILRKGNSAETASVASRYGFDRPGIHIAMLNDRVRTSRYLQALREVVRPGDTVLDIGTGTGVLAIGAAQAGASHVYAVEAGSIAHIAEANFAASGLAGRITVVRGWSTRVDLPERADVLVSEIIGNEPLGERVLEVIWDALHRHLKPGASVIPARVSIFGVLVSVPAAQLRTRLFTESTVRRWRSWYGIDFSPLLDHPWDPTEPLFYVRPHKAKGWQSPALPVLLADIDLRKYNQGLVDHQTTVTVRADGVVTGVLGYFALSLSPSSALATHPAEAGRTCSWRSPVWMLERPIHVRAGDRLVVSYQYRIKGSLASLRVERT